MIQFIRVINQFFGERKVPTRHQSKITSLESSVQAKITLMELLFLLCAEERCS